MHFYERNAWYLRRWVGMAGLSCCGLTAVAACSPSDASRKPAAPITVVDAWMRTVDSGGVGSVYFSFVNNDTATAFLEAFSTPYAQTASLHESVQEHGVVHMASRERYPVPAGSTLQLAPGGLHVMLDPMVRSVTAGDTLTLRITLANGTQLIVPVVVRALTPP